MKRIVDELGDLHGVRQLLNQENTLPLNTTALNIQAEVKRAKLQKYMEYSELCGTLEPLDDKE